MNGLVFIKKRKRKRKRKRRRKKSTKFIVYCHGQCVGKINEMRGKKKL